MDGFDRGFIKDLDAGAVRYLHVRYPAILIYAERYHGAAEQFCPSGVGRKMPGAFYLAADLGEGWVA